ncbi:hypothetical protein Y032_0399g748 [Ancylostoma ceylanicum]|uniref:Uncharacterized protein n=1 Tax=Ancylostoma ceylanicum TaxID=53326 RepID=A0A016RQZ5_9BILA|nr:hypothetical protein Y032_0399g748 [Ancylostoma ceylanicum]
MLNFGSILWHTFAIRLLCTPSCTNTSDLSFTPSPRQLSSTDSVRKKLQLRVTNWVVPNNVDFQGKETVELLHL